MKNCKSKPRSSFKGIAGKLSSLSEPPSIVVRYGAVYPEVLAEAEDWGADLISVASAGDDDLST
jgi:hypothetical protein